MRPGYWRHRRRLCALSGFVHPSRMRSITGMFWAVSIIAGPACVRPVLPPLPASAPETEPLCDGRTRRTDEFVTGGSARLDVLVVVDTGPGSTSLLSVLPERLQPLVDVLLQPSIDFHLAVAPTHLGGVLLPLSAPGSAA